MGKFLAGSMVGCLVTLATLTLFAGLLYVPAERQLIKDWRQIGPGMERATVETILGEPSYDMQPGTSFPEWAEYSVPGDYHLEHGLIVFYISAPGPQLLLVFLDKNYRVSFVSSTCT